MNITLYEGFSKKSNSTLRPSSGGVTVSCMLKEATSLQNPTFILQKAHKGNYVKWDNNYYYVRNVTYLDNNRVELNCELDMLATYKTQIGSFSGYIARCSTGYDADLEDNCISYYDELITFRVAGQANSWPLNNSGTKLLTVYPGNPSLGTTYMNLVINDGSLADVCNLMSVTAEDGLIEAFKETTVDPSRYIAKYFWIPWTPHTFTSGNTMIGGIQGSHSATWTSVDAVTSGSYYFSVRDAVANFPKHFANKITYKLYLPFYGCIDLKLNDKNDTVSLIARCDDNTGTVLYTVYVDSMPVSSITVNMACEMSLATQSNNNLMSGSLSALGGAITTGMGIATGNPMSVAGGISAMASGFTSAVTPSLNSVGSMGSRCFFGQMPVPELKGYKPTHKEIDYTSTCGRPLNEVGTISSHGGYVQTAGANISLPMFSAEVSAMLDKGIYYE